MDTKKITAVLTVFFLMAGPLMPARAAEEELQELEDTAPQVQDGKTAPETVQAAAPEEAAAAEPSEAAPAREETAEETVPSAPAPQQEVKEVPAAPAAVKKTAEEPPSSQGLQNYKIGIGDLLQIEVYDEDDLTKEVRVLTDGYISFPLLGNMRAAGLTVAGLEKFITARLAEKYLVSPQVTVFVKEFSSVYVFGEVKKPGSFPIYGKMTVFEAVTLAGGFTEVANPKKVKVVRQEDGHEVSFEVDTERLTKHGDSSGDRELQANDRVIVPRSFF